MQKSSAAASVVIAGIFDCIIHVVLTGLACQSLDTTLRGRLYIEVFKFAELASLMSTYIPEAPNGPKWFLCIFFRPRSKYCLHTWGPGAWLPATQPSDIRETEEQQTELNWARSVQTKSHKLGEANLPARSFLFGFVMVFWVRTLDVVMKY